MKLRFSGVIFFLISSFFFTVLGAVAQDQRNITYNSFYGLNPSLINGFVYQYPYLEMQEDPFFNHNSFRKGKVKVMGEWFDSTLIKYDVFNQELILKYQDQFGGSKQIRLINEKVEAFEIDGKLFKKLRNLKNKEKYFQVIGNEDYVLSIYFYKELTFNSDGVAERKFTDLKRDYFLSCNGNIHEVNGKKNFLKLIPESKQNDAKSVLKKHGVKFNNKDKANLQMFIHDLNQTIRE